MISTFIYRKQENTQTDMDFKNASPYGKVKLGDQFIFWKKGLRWNAAGIDEVTRAFRRIEGVDTKMCCGNVNFDIQKLVLVSEDGSELELLIGEGTPREAEALYLDLQKRRPGIAYGKV